MPTSRIDHARRTAALRLRPAVAALATAALVLAAMAVTVHSEERDHREAVEVSLVREGSRMRAALERAVDVRIARTEGLVGFAVAQAAQGDIDHDLFERFATQAEGISEVPLRSLQLAPDAVVTHIHPLAGNEEALGHDLLADPDRRAAVEATVAARTTMVAGPFELVQGGVAIVARAPVFLPTDDGGEEWWGLATVVADAEPLFREAELDARDDVDVAVRGRDGLGADGAVFLGDESVFDGDPELFDVTLPAGTWQLGLVPAGGWDAVAWPDRTAVVAGFLVLAALLGALVWRIVATRQRVRRLLEDRSELIGTANAPIVQVTTAGRIVVWNEEAAQLSGLSPTDAIGADVRAEDVPADSLRSVVAELLDQVARDGRRVEGHAAEVTGPDGKQLTLVCNAGPVLDAAGTVTDVVIIGQDVTAEADAARIRQEHEALAAASQLKDEFLATMSHELRTPLNGIIGLCTLLRDDATGELNEQQRQYVEHAHDAGTHLLQLISDVLDLARLDADRDAQATTVPVALHGVVDQAVAMVAQDATSRGLTVAVDLPGDLPPVQADERRLVQVVLNLVANAVKFTDPGGSVTIGASRRGPDHVALHVTDTGIGIAPEDLDRLFAPFVQLDQKLGRRYEGSGLGLALSRRLVDLFDGEIEVDSEPGRGSTFTVVLPASTAVVTPPPPPVPGIADAQLPRATSDGPTVLVAEDNDVNRLILTEYLRTLGYDHVTASDGAEAVQLTRQLRPSLVLMDVQMPRLDGLAATSALKLDPATADIPIIAITALAMSGDEQRCLEAGCDDYLAKPVERDALAAVLREHLGATAASGNLIS